MNKLHKMTRREAELQIDQWHQFYEEGLIDEKRLEDHVELVAAMYRLSRDSSRYDVLDR